MSSVERHFHRWPSHIEDDDRDRKRLASRRTVLTIAARPRLASLSAVNRRIDREAQAQWAPAPLMKTRSAASRRWAAASTDSLCPPASRSATGILSSSSPSNAGHEHVGEIKAQILERTATSSSDPAPPRDLHRHAGHRRQFPDPIETRSGRDFKAVTETLHNHGTASISTAAVGLTIDLTNLCN